MFLDSSIKLLHSQLSDFAFHIQQNLSYIAKNCSHYQLDMQHRFSGKEQVFHLSQINFQYPIYWFAHKEHHYIALKIQDSTNEGWQVYSFLQAEKSISEIWKNLATHYEYLNLEEIPEPIQKFHLFTLKKKEAFHSLHAQLEIINHFDEELIFSTIHHFQNDSHLEEFEIIQASGKIESYSIFLNSLNLICHDLQKQSDLIFPLWPEDIYGHDYLAKQYCIEKQCSLLDFYHHVFCGKNNYQWHNGLLTNTSQTIFYNSKIAQSSLNDIESGYFSLDNFHPYSKNQLLVTWPDIADDKWNQAKNNYLELLKNAWDYFNNSVTHEKESEYKLNFIKNILTHPSYELNQNDSAITQKQKHHFVK
jgi:hypothetical protein